jgi:hypothetical protein
MQFLWPRRENSRIAEKQNPAGTTPEKAKAANSPTLLPAAQSGLAPPRRSASATDS